MLVAQRAVETVEELSAASCIAYDEPKEIACFSRAADRSVAYNDRSQLRAFVRASVGADLNKGFDTFVDKAADAGAPLGDVLGALAHKGLDTDSAHFVTYRNNLNKLLHVPYNARDAWEIGVERRGRTVHLHVLQTEAERAREAGRSEAERRTAYWGYAFEAASTASEAAGGSDDGPLNANAEFCSVARTKLGGNRLVFAAEVDAERRGFGEAGGGERAMRQYVELKTTKLLDGERERHTLERHKMAKWWLQSFLLGVRTVVCGFRDEGGVLRKTQDFETKQLPKFVRGAWHPHVMLNFGDAALGWLYERVIAGPPTGRYVLAYDPAGRRLLLRIAPAGVLPEPTPSVGAKRPRDDEDAAAEDGQARAGAPAAD